MEVQTTSLYLLQELEDPNRTKTLDDPDLRALRSVADWIKTFVVMPHKDTRSRWACLSFHASLSGRRDPLARC